MGYLYEACDQISDLCHQQLLRKMRRKISWTDRRTDRGKTVYPPPPSGSGGINTSISFAYILIILTYFLDMLSYSCIIINNISIQFSLPISCLGCGLKLKKQKKSQFIIILFDQRYKEDQTQVLPTYGVFSYIYNHYYIILRMHKKTRKIQFYHIIQLKIVNE